jgi:hypothetical protein
VFICYRIGPLILLIFFGMLLFGYVYVYLFIPETKGMTLEEVSCKASRYLTTLAHRSTLLHTGRRTVQIWGQTVELGLVETSFERGGSSESSSRTAIASGEGVD